VCVRERFSQCDTLDSGSLVLLITRSSLDSVSAQEKKCLSKQNTREESEAFPPFLFIYFSQAGKEKRLKDDDLLILLLSFSLFPHPSPGMKTVTYASESYHRFVMSSLSLSFLFHRQTFTTRRG